MRQELFEKIKITEGFFCPAPFMHTYLNVSKDQMKMCCMGRMIRTRFSESSSGIPVRDRLKEFFYNDEQLLQIRKKLLKGEEPLECHACGDRERKGWSSDRLEYLNRDGGQEDQKITFDIKYGNEYKQPLALDIRPGNVCNLKCRMCDPGNSSEIFKELDQNPNLDQYYRGEDWRGRTKNTSTDLIKFLSSIDFKLIKRLNILGGEPTVDPDTIAFLEKLVEKGNTDLDLIITSNCTNFNKHWQLFKQFKNLNVCASLDGTGKTYEYIRTNAKWKPVINNVHSLLKLDNLQYLSINLVLQMYNIFDVKIWGKFFYNLYKEGREHGHLAGEDGREKIGAPFIQACEEPPHFHPAILFDDDKKFIIKEINDLIKEENIKDERFINDTLVTTQTCLNDPIWEKFPLSAYPTIKPNDVNELRRHFKNHTLMQDKIRNTNVLNYLHPRIKKYI